MAVVATGFFDGVHLGHRKVLEALSAQARLLGTRAVAVTFSRHPRSVFGRDSAALKLLTCPEEREAEILRAGADEVQTLPFTREFAAMTAREYLHEVLEARFGATAVVLGYDNRFGSDLLPTDGLAELVRSEGFGCVVVEPLVVDGVTVSSTKIRSALEAGKVDAAARMLGRDYSVSGEVVHGKKLGRTIGFPTANLRLPDPGKLVPAGGVYFTTAILDGKRYPSMTNVGSIVETHLLDFDGDLYGRTLGVEFHRRIRDTRPFDSLGALAAQLRSDAAFCRSLL